MLKITTNCHHCGAEIDITDLALKGTITEDGTRTTRAKILLSFLERIQEKPNICDNCAIEHNEQTKMLKEGWRHVLDITRIKHFIPFGEAQKLAKDMGFNFFTWNDTVRVTETGLRYKKDLLKDDNAYNLVIADDLNKVLQK